MSVRWSSRLPLSCSGDMYDIVPKRSTDSTGSVDRFFSAIRVNDLHPRHLRPVIRDQDIGGLEVAMDHVAAVCRHKPFGNLDSDLQRRPQLETARLIFSPRFSPAIKALAI